MKWGHKPPQNPFIWMEFNFLCILNHFHIIKSEPSLISQTVANLISNWFLTARRWKPKTACNWNVCNHSSIINSICFSCIWLNIAEFTTSLNRTICWASILCSCPLFPSSFFYFTIRQNDFINILCKTSFVSRLWRRWSFQY